MKKVYLLLLIILVIALGLVYLRYIRVPENTLKTAITRSSLADKEYIICQREMVTGYDWLVVTDNTGMNNYYCNIEGINPFNDLSLNDDFIFADNRYVFYIVEKKEYYSEELQEDCIEYVVNGWDILFPINHGNLLNILSSPRYITTKDTRTNVSLAPP